MDGDVWKALAILKRFRPDLQIHAFNAHPTGMATISNFDPSSELLGKRYHEIVAEYGTLDLAEYGVELYLQEMEVEDTKALADDGAISRLVGAVIKEI